MDLTTVYYPNIISYTPNESSTGVTTLPDITIEFSIPMELTQFTTSGILNQRLLLIKQADNASLDLGYISYTSSTNTLTVRPCSYLTMGEIYQVTALSTLKSTTNRTMTRNVSWTFAVSATAIGTTTLLAPSNETISSTFPTFSWSAATSATGYDLEISTSTSYASGFVKYSGTSSGTALTPNASDFTVNNQYYWRVRGTSGTADGPWSDTWTFYYGDFVDTSLDSRVVSAYAGTFDVVSLYPDDGTSNRSTFPLIYAIWNTAPATATITSATFMLSYTGIDGDPNNPTGYLEGTYSTAGLVTTFTPSSTIANNTRYTITIYGVTSSGGNSMLSPVTSYFTGPYIPLYANVLSVRAKCGSFASTFTDDYINYLLYQASMNCNYIMLSNSSQETTYLSGLQANDDTITYQMVRYTIAYAAYSLLQVRQFELLEEADRKKQLGDFMEDVGAGSLIELGKLLRELKKELSEFELSLVYDLVQPKVGVRNSSWTPSEYYDDSSISNLRRSSF